MNTLKKISILSGTAVAGYLLGKSENQIFKSENGYWDGPGIPIFPRVIAATPVESNESRFKGVAVPDQLPAEIKNDGKVSVASRVGQVMKYGFPSLDNVRSYEDFVLSYNRRNRVADWVFEHLTKDTVKYNENVDRSKCEFFEDSSIHPYFSILLQVPLQSRSVVKTSIANQQNLLLLLMDSSPSHILTYNRSKNSDYKGSGFDRGHLAAAGNHKWSQKQCEQTFVLSNMAPQVGHGFNRDSWNRLEKHVRKLARKYQNVYVCTGPLYLPKREADGKLYVKYQVIGANTVSVPTHFFKIVVMETPESTFEVESYVMPNAVISDNTPLTSFQVPPESIERAAGFLFFEKLPKDKLKKINGKSNSRWL